MIDRAIDKMRIAWIDYVKAFSIMAVVLYHTNITPEIQRLVYILCLPAFFFISGLFLDSNLTVADFLKKRTMRLLIPYIIWGVFSWLAWLLVGRNYGTDTTDQEVWWLPLAGIACGKVEWLVHNRPLWFLCCLVSIDWFYYIISKLPSQVLQWIVCLIIAAIGCILGDREFCHIWSITPAMIMLPLYMVGTNSKIYVTQKVMMVDSYKGGGLFTISLLGIGIAYFFNSNINLSLGIIGSPFLFYIGSFSVVAFWIMISILLNNRLVSPLLSTLGKNTLIILCTHIPLFGAIKGVCMIFGVPLVFFETNIGSIVLWISAIVLSFPLIYVINRFFPFLIGKRRETTP